MLVKEMMKKKVVTVNDTDNVRTICKMLTKYKFSGFPVINKSGKLVGFISERDIISAVCKPNFISRTAKQLMTKKVRTLPEDSPVTHASKVFAQEKYRHIPIVRGKKVVGILTRKDIATHMMKHYY